MTVVSTPLTARKVAQDTLLNYRRKNMPKINDLKKALTFEEQLDHLINDKKMVIKNKKNALFILKHENYYRLSGYMVDFLNEDDEFQHGVTFEEVYNIYKTDKEIRSVLFELINDIEVYLKTQVANYFCLTYGPDGYRNPFNFACKSNEAYSDIINLLKKCNDISKHNPENLIIKHHKDKYGGFMPLWALVELMSFGTISKFFSIMQTPDKKAVCRRGYEDISFDKLESFYHSIAYLRNQCCHYQRFYRIHHIIKPKKYIPTDISLGEVKLTSTYGLVLALLFVNPNRKLGERAINKLKNIDSHTKIHLSENYGFNDNWKDVLYEVNGHCIEMEIE